MTAQLPNSYQSNFDPSKNYFEPLFFPGKGLAAYEKNDVFKLIDHKRKELAKLIVTEGDIVDGASPVVDSLTGDVRIPPGKIFVKDEIIPYPESTFTIAVDTTIKLGVFVEELLISGGEDEENNEDPDLLDPSADIDGKVYATSGTETSKRLQNKLTWGWKDSEGGASQEEGVFYGIFSVTNGILILPSTTTSKSGIVEEIARYDRDVNGNYIVKGLEVSFDYENIDSDFYILDVKPGTANVNGFKRTRTSNDKFRVDIDPDLRQVDNDPFVITVVNNLEYTATITKGSANGSDALGRVDVQSISSVTSLDGLTTYTPTTDYVLSGNNISWAPGGVEPTTGAEYLVTFLFTGALVETDKAPIDSVSEVVANLEITEETVVRGAVANTTDSLAHTSVTALIEVKQGLTTFVPGTDYILTGSTVNWSPGGAEPSVTSSYTVTYRYNRSILPDTGSINNGQFTITNKGVNGDLVDGSSVLATYDYRLRRIDLLELDQSGNLNRVKGVSQDSNPNVPAASPNAIALATINLDWVNEPKVRNVGNIAIQQGDLQDLRNKQYTQGILIAELQLQLNAVLAGASNAGMFVDSFTDIDKTDLGIEQSLTIADDLLSMPLLVTTGDLDNEANLTYHTLEATDELIVEQNQRTAVMKINPYATFVAAQPIIIDTKIDYQVDDFTDRTMIGGSNPDPNSWIKNPGPVNVTPTGGDDPVVDPKVPTLADRMTLAEFRQQIKDAKGVEQLSPKGRQQTLNAYVKLLSGEQIETVKVGKQTFDVDTGAMIKTKK